DFGAKTVFTSLVAWQHVRLNNSHTYSIASTMVINTSNALLTLAGTEGLDSRSASPKLHLCKLVCKRRFPCERPQDVLTPNAIRGLILWCSFDYTTAPY